MFDLVVAAAAVGVWLLAYAACRLLTRPASPAAAPATMELGPESPAVVSLLVNRWTLTEDAAESTLLDLAARRFVELRQPGLDPTDTTVHVPGRAVDRTALRPYESQVLDRIRGLAVNGVVPITALTFRNAGDSAAWNKELRRKVIDEARAAGLSRRRISKGVATLLSVLAAGVGVVVAAAAYDFGAGKSSDKQLPWYVLGFFTFALLSVFGARSLGERDTPEGRAAASRWLGVRDWLRGHEQFGSLPPAAVAIWDRYLAYGAAAGVTRLASAVLDLEMADRRLVWSSFGGTWHRVRVRYPSFWPRYGRTLRYLVLSAAAYLGLGFVVLRFLGSSDHLAAVGLLLLMLGTYVLVRALLDLALTREITGEVLWREVWKSRSEGESSVPWLDHLAIDDGAGERTTAWGLPSSDGSGCQDGDVVTVRVRPWSRRVVSMTVVGHGQSRSLGESLTEEETGSLSLALLQESSPAASAASYAAFFAADEVAQVVGVDVRVESVPLGFQYISEISGKAVMLAQSLSGLPGRVAWRANGRGIQVPGGGFVSGERAAFRHDETTYVVTLLGEGRAGRDRLPWLVGQAAARHPRPLPPLRPLEQTD